MKLSIVFMSLSLASSACFWVNYHVTSPVIVGVIFLVPAAFFSGCQIMQVVRERENDKRGGK
jgi:hypothetical protein